MTWPTSDVTTTSLDAGTDSPQTARAHLLDLAQKFNQVRAHGAVFEQGLAAATYTPIITNLTNASSAPVFSAMYMQLGAFVLLHIGVSVTVSAVGDVSFNASIPVASDFSTTGDGVGSGSAAGTTIVPVRLVAVGASDTISVFFKAAASGAHTLTASFMYRVI